MRHALCCVICLSACARWTAAAKIPSSDPPKPDVTVVLDFKGTHSASSDREMQHETEGIIKDSGLHLQWRTVNEALHNFYTDLVIVRFRGACTFEADPNIYDELGPPGALAFTYTTNGEVQPFSEVACDRVAASVRSAMWGSDFARSDMLMGRALGRVVAHELVHMLTKSGEHGEQGVGKPALSGKQLISDSFPLSRADSHRLRVDYALRLNSARRLRNAVPVSDRTP